MKKPCIRTRKRHRFGDLACIFCGYNKKTGAYDFGEILNEVYIEGMAKLRKHSETVVGKVMRSRSEGKGNFAYLQDLASEKAKEEAAKLRLAMWQEWCMLIGVMGAEGCCGKKCYGCTDKRYNFHVPQHPTHWNNDRAEGWYCQRECQRQ